jgi:iron complex transport system permease protein
MNTWQSSYTRSLPIRSDKQKLRVIAALTGLMLLAAMLSLAFGSQSYSLSRLFGALGSDAADPARRILLHVRIPRTLECAAAGAALAVAGVLLQAVLNNAMASPNVIGVNAGAGFFALLASSLLPGSAAAVSAAAFVGALGAAMLIYLLALRAGLSRTTLVLAGIAVGGMLTAGVNALRLLYPDAAVGSDAFMAGGFSGATMESLNGALPFLLAGLILALILSPDVNVLCLGEESAAGLGLSVGRTRFLAILASALLAGAAVSFAGLLSFVGLLVPHIARKFIGSDHRWLIPASALLGAAFVTICDVISRVVFAPYEFPSGILLSLLGGPFFLSLLLGHKRGRLYD